MSLDVISKMREIGIIMLFIIYMIVYRLFFEATQCFIKYLVKFINNLLH